MVDGIVQFRTLIFTVPFNTRVYLAPSSSEKKKLKILFVSADSLIKAKTYIFGNNVTKFYCSGRKLPSNLFYLGEKKSNKCKYYLSSTSYYIFI